MNKNLTEIVDYLNKTRASLFNIFEGLSPDKFKSKGNKGGWSAGEVVNHLYLTEVQITALLQKQLERAEKKNIGPDKNNESFLHSLDKYFIEEVREKYTAPVSTLPENQESKEKLAEFINISRSDLLSVLEELGKYDMSKLEFPHPLTGRINMYQWIVFLGKHEERHINQIRNIIK